MDTDHGMLGQGKVVRGRREGQLDLKVSHCVSARRAARFAAFCSKSAKLTQAQIEAKMGREEDFLFKKINKSQHTGILRGPEILRALPKLGKVLGNNNLKTTYKPAASCRAIKEIRPEQHQAFPWG